MGVFTIGSMAIPATAVAQSSFPEHKYRNINDYADVILPSDEAKILSHLRELRTQSGIQVEILTVDSIYDYDVPTYSSIESFATDVFNDWGIGDPVKNDGILLLVAVEDRDVRIEVGSGYGNSQDYNMGVIIREHLLPHFRQERYSEGITRATGAIVAEFTGAWPQDIDSSRLKVQPDPVVARRAGSNVDWGTIFFIIILIAGSILWSKIAQEMGFDTSSGSGSSYDDDDWGSSSGSSGWSSSSSSSSSRSSSSGGGRSSGGGSSGSW